MIFAGRIAETIVKNIPCDEAEDSDSLRDLIGYHLGIAVSKKHPKHGVYYYSKSHRWHYEQKPMDKPELAPSALWHTLYRIAAMQGHDRGRAYYYEISIPQEHWLKLNFCVRSTGAPIGWTFSKDKLSLNNPHNHEAGPLNQQRPFVDPGEVQSMLEIVRQIEEVNYNANCYYNFPDDQYQMLDADFDRLDSDLTANIVKFHKLWLATK